MPTSMTRVKIPKEKPERREEPLVPMPTIPKKEPNPLPAPDEPEKVPVGGIENKILMEGNIEHNLTKYPPDYDGINNQVYTTIYNG